MSFTVNFWFTIEPFRTRKMHFLKKKCSKYFARYFRMLLFSGNGSPNRPWKELVFEIWLFEVWEKDYTTSVLLLKFEIGNYWFKEIYTWHASVNYLLQSPSVIVNFVYIGIETSKFKDEPVFFSENSWCFSVYRLSRYDGPSECLNFTNISYYKANM